MSRELFNYIQNLYHLYSNMLVYLNIKYSLCELSISVILINHIVPKSDEIIFCFCML